MKERCSSLCICGGGHTRIQSVVRATALKPVQICQMTSNLSDEQGDMGIGKIENHQSITLSVAFSSLPLRKVAEYILALTIKLKTLFGQHKH